MDKSIGLCDAGDILWDEDGALIRVVSENNRHFDETALLEKAIGLVWNEVAVYSWPVHI